jgi:phosphomannomutase
VAGYEANGGFLLATPVRRNGQLLTALPTRDAVIVLLSLLHDAIEQQSDLSELTADLPQRFTYSARIKNFATQTSQQLLAKYTAGSFEQNKQAIEADFPQLCEKLGAIENVNTIDGLRITFNNADIIHFRPSGNAPEFRCYSESENEANASVINNIALQRVLQLGQLLN